MKVLWKRKIGLVFIVIQTLLTLALIGYVMYVNMIPNKYLLVLVLVLLFFLAYTFVSQITHKFYTVGRVLSAIVCIIIVFCGYYQYRTYSTIQNVSEAEIKIDVMTVLVLNEDPAQTIDDAKDYTFGIIKTIKRDNTDETIAQINQDTATQIAIKEYQDMDELVTALYEKEVEVIILNEANRTNILESHKNFDTETRKLGDHQIETVVEVEPQEQKDITNTPFSVYISGIDTYGSIAKTSRSDVNIIATINPVTKQILLVSTPRDYFIPLSISKGVGDKLTHAGIYGVDCSIDTLKMLYDMDIDYYLRVNFTGVTKIVDSLGGVKVHSDQTFTADWGPSFKKGDNQVNGTQALAFARQRKKLPGGDRQRGKNHQYLIKAIIDKVSSPSILKNFSGFLTSAEGAFETNMKSDDITKLVKFQLDQMPEWNITSISVDGTGARKYTYSISSKSLYVMIPDEDIVEDAKEKIQKILNGETILEETDAPTSLPHTN